MKCEVCHVPLGGKDTGEKVVCSQRCVRVYKRWVRLKEPKVSLHDYFVQCGLVN
jgi:hypothetical protein